MLINYVVCIFGKFVLVFIFFDVDLIVDVEFYGCVWV